MAGLYRKNTALFLSLLLFFFTIFSFIAAGTLFPAQAAFAANPVIYRGLFVGCGDYEGEYYDLSPSTVNDANECCYVFSNAAYDGVSKVKGKMAVAADIGKSTLLGYLDPSVSSGVFYGADANDISIFYFSGHGTDYDEDGRPAIVLSDGAFDETMSVDELEAALHNIPGRKIVILDSCFSGGMIGRSYTKSAKSSVVTKATATPTAAPAATATDAPSPAPAPTATAATGSSATAVPAETPAPTQTTAPVAAQPSAAEQAAFAEALIQPFRKANQRFQTRALLSQPEYIVFTASSGDNPAYGEAEGADAMGCFTRSYTDGLGRLGQYSADGNSNKYISVREAYSSALKRFSNYYSGESTAQVYPEDSTFTLLKYEKSGAVATGTANKNTCIYSSTLSQKTKLCSLPYGTSVNIYGMLGNFYKVNLGYTFGYAHKNYVDIASGSVGTPVLGTGKSKTVTYVYTTTSTSSTKLRKLSAGAVMDILGVSGSCYIVTASGVTGCVPANTVTVLSGSVGPEPTSSYVLAIGKTTAKTFLYSKANASSTKLRTLDAGGKMTITHVSTSYYKVWMSGVIGYVPKKYVRIVSGTLNGSAPKSTRTTVNAQGEAKEPCYVFSGTGSAATKLFALKQGVTVSILSTKGNYYKVLKNGKIGYVLSGCIKILSPCTLSAAGRAKSTCYIYGGRSTTSPKKLTLDTGGCMSILGVYGSFYTVTVSGVSGYIPVKYIYVL